MIDTLKRFFNSNKSCTFQEAREAAAAVHKILSESQCARQKIEILEEEKERLFNHERDLHDRIHNLKGALRFIAYCPDVNTAKQYAIEALGKNP